MLSPSVAGLITDPYSPTTHASTLKKGGMMSKGEGWGPFFPHRNFQGVCEAAASNADAVATPHPGASSYRFLLERFFG